MDINIIRNRVLRAIEPLNPGATSPAGLVGIPFESGHRTAAGRKLPAYYLVYFLLVDLLEFGYLGQGEKVAWSIPVNFEGRSFLIEHRKFGLGLFSSDLTADEPMASQVVSRINKAVDVAKTYFDWRAEQAVINSEVNVINRSNSLCERFQFFVGQYNAKILEAQALAKDRTRTPSGGLPITLAVPSFQLREEAEWLALSAIESFFSWTEHVFIHLAILQGKVVTGNDVKEMAGKDWPYKFKTVLDINDRDNKMHYDKLIAIREQRRNFVAHGSFGKKGEAFLFHSGAGAVPVQLPHYQRGGPYSFGDGKGFDDKDAIELIHNFMDHLWSTSLGPARIYLESGLNIVLTMAQDGIYKQAMLSENAMEEFVQYISNMEDRYANMDF